MKRNSLLLLLTLVTSALAAESLNDPLRPPATFVTPDAQAGAGTGGARLTSILQPGTNGGAAKAIIDGHIVSVGERVGDARLVKLTGQEAVLQGPNGRETLSLTPSVEKKMQEDKKAPKRRKEKR